MAEGYWYSARVKNEKTPAPGSLTGVNGPRTGVSGALLLSASGAGFVAGVTLQKPRTGLATRPSKLYKAASVLNTDAASRCAASWRRLRSRAIAIRASSKVNISLNVPLSERLV